MERQHLTRTATQADYDALYRDLQPGQNVYWNGFGDPPTLTYRADFDEILAAIHALCGANNTIKRYKGDQL
jgi:hypothetical protein